MTESSHTPSPSHSLCVIGHPIGHSLSPLMHATAFKALGLDWTYSSLDVEAGDLKTTLKNLVKKGFAGFNVTIPHKETILPLLHELDKEARAIGAVNTVSIRGGKLRGFNTDVDGIAKSLDEHQKRIEKEPVVIVGTGGAARAVAHTLISRFQIAGLTVVSRSEEKARLFVSTLAKSPPLGTSMGFTGNEPELQKLIREAALIVNATPIGMQPKVKESPLRDEIRFRRGQIVFDLIYTPLKTTLMKRAEADGARMIGGLEMFLQQGARAFGIWTGKEMPVEIVRPVIESALQAF